MPEILSQKNLWIQSSRKYFSNLSKLYQVINIKFLCHFLSKFSGVICLSVGFWEVREALCAKFIALSSSSDARRKSILCRASNYTLLCALALILSCKLLCNHVHSTFYIVHMHICAGKLQLLWTEFILVTQFRVFANTSLFGSILLKSGWF